MIVSGLAPATVWAKEGGSGRRGGGQEIQKSVIWRYVFRENDPATIIFSAQIGGICVFFGRRDSYSEGKKVLTLVRFDEFLRIEFSLGKSGF